jgi:hypothetical protein
MITEEKLVQDMLSRVRQINRMPDDVRATLLDFKVDGTTLGKVSGMPEYHDKNKL